VAATDDPVAARRAYWGPLALHDRTVILAIAGSKRSQSGVGSADRRRPSAASSADRPATTWSYWRAYGCNTINASQNLLLFRSGAAGFADLEHDGGTGNLRRFRSGCTNNLIAANGVLNAPDYTRTCTCSYHQQTSLALIHMPHMDVWTANPGGLGSGKIARWASIWAPRAIAARKTGRCGSNTRRPGRRAPSWTFASSPTTSPGTASIRCWSMIPKDTAGSPRPVAKGCGRCTSATCSMLAIVRLHFCRAERNREGERVFDVLLQGSRFENFDIVRRPAGPTGASSWKAPSTWTAT
jgi:hypothetical protein